MAITDSDLTVRMTHSDKIVLLLIATIGSLISIFFYFVVASWEFSVQKNSFEHAATKKINLFSQEIERYKSVLKSLVNFHNSSEEITRSEFHEFVRDSTKNDNVFRAIEWMPRVTESQRESFVQAAKDQGFSQFEITQKDSDCKLVKRSPAKEYFPVLYVEPFKGNELILGFDPSSNPDRFRSLVQSWETGKIFATEPLKLVQGNNKERGLIMFAPAYRRGVNSDSVEARRENLQGFFLAVFDLNAFIQKTLHNYDDQDMNVYLFDSSNPDHENLIYSSSGTTSEESASKKMSNGINTSSMRFSTEIDNSGRKWKVVYEQPQKGLFSSQTWLPLAILACCLLVTALITTYIAFLKMAKKRSERWAETELAAKEGIEREIGARNQAIAALEHRELILRNIFDSSIDGIMLTKPDGSILKANSAACKMLGWSEGELIEIGRAGVTDGADDNLKEAIEERLKKGQASRMVPFRRKNGETFPAHVSSGLFRDEPGNLFSTVVFRDISNEKKSEESVKKLYLQTKALIDNIPDLVWLKDAESHFLIINEAFAKSCGTPSDDIAGKTDYDVWPKEMAQVYIADDFEVMRSGVRKIVEEPVADINSAIGWIETIKTPIFDTEGRVIGTAGTARDVTARVLAEQTHKLLATAVEHSAESIMVTDAEGIIKYVNPAFEKISGYSTAEVVGQNPRILKSGEHHEEFYKDIWQTLMSGGTWSGLIKNRRKNGSLAYEKSNISPVKDQKGEIVAFVGVNRDVTEERVLQEQLAQSQKMEAIGTLAGGIAHDFNNIIFAIIGYAELALDHTKDDPQVAMFIEEIISASERAGDMVKQILTFSRQSRPEKTVLDVRPIIKEGLKFLRGALPSSIEIKQDIEKTIPYVYADPTQVYQVLMNLCTNATFAMRDSNGVLSVSLERVDVGKEFASQNPGVEPGQFVRLTVADTGEGMPQSLIKRIFEPYFTTKDIGEGTGLGLSVLDGIVKNHGGVVTVWSELGKGSKFSVYFPVIDDNAMPVQNAKPEIKLEGDERILWVDDESTLMEMCRETLGRAGFSVTCTTDPLQALEIFRHSPDSFDLVMTDFSMPGVNGIELARKVSAINPQIPIILCTGFGNSIPVSLTKPAGITMIVSKPVSSKDLIYAIRQTLDRPTDPAG